MGLDIKLTIRKDNEVYDEEEFNGRVTFLNIRNFMVGKYNYQYGECLKLNITIIKSMVEELINECWGKLDYIGNQRRLDFVRSLMDSYDYIKKGYEAYFECNW